MSKLKLQNLINHIAFVIDASGSMAPLTAQVEQVFDKEIENLKKASISSDQETRVSIYFFSSNSVECVVFDMDVMRVKSLKTMYHAAGGTPLIDGAVLALNDFKLLPERYGDHAFLTVIITDGQENTSRNSANTLERLIQNAPDNYTITCLVPSQQDKFYAMKYGIPKDNISIWDTTREGLEKAGGVFGSSMTNYMTMRAAGVKSTKSFYSVDTSKLNTKNVNKLQELEPTKFTVFPVRKDERMDTFMTTWKGAFVNGAGYYELTKAETIQGYKELAIQDKRNGKVYSGVEVRNLLNIPLHDIKVNPADHDQYRIFVQSTAPNRKLLGGTLCLVMS